MLKSLFFILHNHRVKNCRIIVRNKTCDVTVSELNKCGKFETVLVSSSQRTSEENHLNSKVSTFKFLQNPKLKREWLIKMKRECFMPSKLSCVCVKHFIEECFEQNLVVRSLLGPSFKLHQLVVKKDALLTTFKFTVEHCKPAIGQKRNTSKYCPPSSAQTPLPFPK